MRKHPVTEKGAEKGRYRIRVPAFVIQKGEFMAQKKRLGKFLPRLLAAAVAAATLIGSGGIGGINVVNLSRKSANYKFTRMKKPFVIP